MEEAKISFFKRVKKAIVKFENYSDFAVEKMSIAIKYLAKLMLIFSLIISIALSYKFSTIVNDEEQLQIMQNQLAENGVNLEVINESLDYLRNNNNLQFYIVLALSVTVYIFAIYFIATLIDALLVSIIGFLASRLTRIVLKYKPIFIMSIYALTLPIILNCIYIVVNTLTGFTIDYFTIVYNVIAYIYIITAILMIKTDFIEQQRELIRIIQEQRKVRQEEKKEEKEDDKDKQPEEQDDNEKDIPPEEPNSESQA